MKRLVKVSVGEFATKWPSIHYINKAYFYNVDCIIVSRDLGIFKDKYILELSGTEENIQMFLQRLKLERFKIIE